MRLPRVLSVVGFLLVLAAAAWSLFAPTYSTRTESSDGTVTEGTLSGLAANGPDILIPVGIAILLAALAAWAPWRWLRWVGAVVLGGFCILAALSIGAFFLPGALCLLLALVLDTPTRRVGSPPA